MSSPENNFAPGMAAAGGTVSAGAGGLLFTAVKRQLFYKMEINAGRFGVLLALQLFAACLSLGGAENAGSSSGWVTVKTSLISFRTVLSVSLIWAVVFPLLLAGRDDRKILFSLPGNRLSDTVSDIGEILAACALGGISASLLYAATRGVLFLAGGEKLLSTDFYFYPDALFLVAAGIFFYMLIFASLGYLVGTLGRPHNALYLIFPVLLFGIVCPLPSPSGATSAFALCWDFIFRNGSLPELILKAAAVSGTLFVLSALSASRMEVRK